MKKIMMMCAAIAAMVSVIGNAAEPVSPVGRVALKSKDRTWKIIYGSSEGPEGRALELLSAEIGSIYIRDRGVYTIHVLPCEKAGSRSVPAMTNAFVIGTWKSNPALHSLITEADIPAGGYLVKTIRTAAGERVVLAGSTPAAVIWAVADFLDDGLPALAVKRWDGLQYVSEIFNGSPLGRYESRRAPKTPKRSVFLWAHTMNDYREYFRNLARMKFNEVILWNNRPPVNAREVVDYAKSWGLTVLWGYAWGWSTNCTRADLGDLGKLEEDIVREWRETWRPLGGDGIYFQSFTELAQSEIGGRSIAEAVVELVNSVAARIRKEEPDLRIVFGLHASSVKGRLAVIDRTDKSVEILWEDMGGFPFNRGKSINPAADRRLVDAILAEDREVGLVFKCQLVQDWQHFAYQAGPYVLGCDSRATAEEDEATAEELWRPFLVDWHTHGRLAYDYIRRIQKARPDRPAALNIAANINGKIRFITALVAEMFWSADDPYDVIVNRVLKRKVGK